MTNTPTRPAERALVVEDDRALRELMADELRDHGLEVTTARSAEEALVVMEQAWPHLVLSDLRLPGRTGMELLALARERPRPPAFIVVTAYGSISQAVEALKRGADDFLTKPLDLDHLRLRVQRLLEIERLRREVERHRLGPDGSFHGIVGESPAMRELFEQIHKVAQGRGPVTVVGESGVGKELVARAIHRESARRDGPFVPVNCAGIPENLMESELFGHESGSFTGATRTRQGLFAAADGGTLLLDEVGELSPPMQAKLLRVLQEGAVRRVGSNDTLELDVRVIVATHRDLERDVADERFRDDLFYRLATFILEVPALHQRRGDIELLAAHFLRRDCAEVDRDIAGFEPEVLDYLRGYRFPGNVRELENVVEHAVTFCQGARIAMRDLPSRVRPERAAPAASLPGPFAHGEEILTLDELTARYVRHVLERTEGNKRRAASLLGIGRQTLYRHLSRDGG
jgi:two-component system, NtrC family, response regulator AtoC